MAAASSCQKDAAVNNPDPTTTTVSADSSAVSSPNNFLAVSGTLKIKFNDSTYTFNAATDSIAFINVRSDDNTRYFGITAINKDHSMSFGISSAGFPYSNINRAIAGSQFIMSADAKQPALQLSLSRYSEPKSLGNINVVQYNSAKELAKGTFYTFMARDDKANSPYYRVEGTFDLQLK
ncbi:hypothetical protein [Mucilaginibacter gotjawali]|uniref:Uncharacterized protein n=2 Tax=Mucilaginibacter gotjawali TaxID=1550579 RepID=A0A839SG24_9SPHI|nr:hypothetical protein [Mucilaginibacter gotjawali]MBB3057245.1 hypothetical protein [Mucilaginibacter gotjawali]BAU52987.1 hypothetical protein MgSA37_01154 [Mucilaginibacter gotjawali]